MFKALTDAVIVRGAGAAGLLRGFCVLPVLHVERLHEDRSFDNALQFCRDYQNACGRKPLVAAIPPNAPLLVRALDKAGFPEAAYAERLAELARVADIGLHGHYLRGDSGAPIHHYWSERAPVHAQMSAEIAWLESRGLMRRRFYAAGWWYEDSMLRELLREFGFEFDFSLSVSRYNLGPLSWQGPRSADAIPPGPVPVWAVCRICATGTHSHVPRQLLRGFGPRPAARWHCTVSLYGHDWDMDPAAARVTLRDLARAGARLIGLQDLTQASARPLQGVCHQH